MRLEIRADVAPRIGWDWYWDVHGLLEWDKVGAKANAARNQPSHCSSVGL
jgi:hypothetical protein